MAPAPLPPVIERLQRAWNAHDVNAVGACWSDDAVSVHPAHPERNARGRDAICRRWALTFAGVPTLTAELVRSARSDSVVWTEWVFWADTGDGPPYRAGGVMIFGVEAELIAWVRVFTEAQPLEGPDWERELEAALKACGSQGDPFKEIAPSDALDGEGVD